jgi:hypothetical protein
MQAPPGALAKAPVVARVVALASSAKPKMIFLANIGDFRVSEVVIFSLLFASR